MLLIRHIRQLITCAGAAPRSRARSARPRRSSRTAPSSADGERILFAGPDRDLPASLTSAPDTRVIDGRASLGRPGLRRRAHARDVRRRSARRSCAAGSAGATYAEIAAEGGGIVSTVRATRAASEDDAGRRDRAAARRDAGLRHDDRGDQERLRPRSRDRAEDAAGDPARSARDQPVDLVATFMGAHEIPLDYRGRREDYVRLVIDEMIPAVAGGGLAEWCDVFCEHGVFTPDESTRILQAGAARGLKPRIHADELGASGGSQVAARRRRAIGRSPDLRAGGRHPRHARRGRRRDAAAQRRLLPEARTLRSGAGADRRRRAGRARDRRQSRRRILAVDAVRHDARLLRRWG